MTSYKNLKVSLAEPSGACYGVERALDMVYEAIDESGGKVPVYTLGPLIHNPIVVRQLEAKSVSVAESIDEVDEGILVVRSHGVPAGVVKDARDKGITVRDATCPHVSKAQLEASRLASEGRFVIIIGEAGHPEVEAIRSYAGDDVVVISDESEIPDLPCDTKVGVVVQTTQPIEKLEAISKKLKSRYGQIVIENTICSATRKRQDAALATAREADVMIVIGGRNSGNTRRLYEICCTACPETHHIESIDELEPEWFSDGERVGVTAGASTPQSHISAAMSKLSSM